MAQDKVLNQRKQYSLVKLSTSKQMEQDEAAKLEEAFAAM